MITKTTKLNKKITLTKSRYEMIKHDLLVPCLEFGVIQGGGGLPN